MTKPNSTSPWMRRSGSIRVTSQLPDDQRWQYESDPSGTTDFRIASETVDGAVYQYGYDDNGCLVSRVRLQTS